MYGSKRYVHAVQTYKHTRARTHTDEGKKWILLGFAPPERNFKCSCVRWRQCDGVRVYRVCVCICTRVYIRFVEMMDCAIKRKKTKRKIRCSNKHTGQRDRSKFAALQILIYCRTKWGLQLVSLVVHLILTAAIGAATIFTAQDSCARAHNTSFIMSKLYSSSFISFCFCVSSEDSVVCGGLTGIVVIIEFNAHYTTKCITIFDWPILPRRN